MEPQCIGKHPNNLAYAKINQGSTFGLLSNSSVDTIQPKPYQISISIPIDIAECTNKSSHRPTMGEVKSAGPLGGSGSKAGSIGESDIDTIQSKSYQISISIPVHIANRADKVFDRPTMRERSMALVHLVAVGAKLDPLERAT